MSEGSRTEYVASSRTGKNMESGRLGVEILDSIIIGILYKQTIIS